MVCDFCLGTVSDAGKSFSRVDVFKRHLTSIHYVEQQTLFESHKRRLGLVKKFIDNLLGKCSTCSVIFTDA